MAALDAWVSVVTVAGTSRTSLVLSLRSALLAMELMTGPDCSSLWSGIVMRVVGKLFAGMMA